MSIPSIRGTTALVTGASSGLGRDMAKDLARRGCNLVIVARRLQRLEELRDELEARNGISVRVLTADLSQPGAASSVFEWVDRQGLRIDILVNNAGFGKNGNFLDSPWAAHEELVSVDVLAPLHLARLFVPRMVERDWGRVMFVASNMAYQASPGFATYGAAKAFILLFGEALAFELRRTGVRITTVSPGMTNTEFEERAGHSPNLYTRIIAMSSDEVARECVRAMLRGTPSTVIGTRNKLLELSGRLMPRRLATELADRARRSRGED